MVEIILKIDINFEINYFYYLIDVFGNLKLYLKLEFYSRSIRIYKRIDFYFYGFGYVFSLFGSFSHLATTRGFCLNWNGSRALEIKDAPGLFLTLLMVLKYFLRQVEKFTFSKMTFFR